ncbi:MAG: hypothetical protein P8X70_03135, partial [Nanoarchaeota archaeon]
TTKIKKDTKINLETYMRRLYLESLGCARNQVDSEIMIGRLKRAGWDGIIVTGTSSRIQGSDIHLVVGKPPLLRINGELSPIPKSPVLPRATLEKMVYTIFMK